MSNGAELKRKILGAISIHGNMSVAELAKYLRARPHVVRYNLDQLLQSGAINRSVLIDQRNLGLSICSIHFDIPTKAIAATLKFLCARREVCWLCQNTGEREFEMSVIVRDSTELLNLITSLGETVGINLKNHSITFEQDLYHWGLRFLSEGDHTTKPFVFRKHPPFEPDNLDLQILRACKGSEHLELSELAKKQKVPPSTIKYRMQRLQAAGVISEERYFLIKAVDEIARAQLEVTLTARTNENEERIVSFCNAEPHVFVLLAGVGHWDYKIVMYGNSLSEIYSAEERFRRTFASILSSTSLYIRRKMFKNTSGL
jgi:DNA-binding Lrp family transcriptional regulator